MRPMPIVSSTPMEMGLTSAPYWLEA
jgi:hypothetical protein